MHQTAVEVLGFGSCPFFPLKFLQPLLVPPPLPPGDAIPFRGLGVDIFDLFGLNPSEMLGEATALGGGATEEGEEEAGAVVL